MSDEITSNPAPVDPVIPQTLETPISTPPEAVVVLTPVEAPIELVPTPEPALESSSGHLGGNDPMEPAPAESIPPIPTVGTPSETPVAVTEPALAETPIPEPAPTETTQQTPTQPVIETVPEPIAVETLTPTQIPEPVTQARVPELTLTPVATTTPNPAQVVATVVAPVIATNIAQTLTKSIRELFTKAQLAIQNRKRKKIDRVMILFAKQTIITNNEVEKLLHVSDSTATRYLATLTKEGKIKQNTKKGQATSYSKI